MDAASRIVTTGTGVESLSVEYSSAKTDPASDLSALCPDASDVFSASPASCAS